MSETSVAVSALALSIVALLMSALAMFYAKRQAYYSKRANERAEEADRVRWRVGHGDGDNAFVLRQTGTETVHDVRAWSKSVLFLNGDLTPDGDRLAKDTVVPQGSIKFTALPATPWVGTGAELFVTWNGQETPVGVPMPGKGSSGQA